VEIIDRYVYEVGLNLPAESDVPEELQSLLLDKVEQRRAHAQQRRNRHRHV
jgi:hypothetical protein